MSRLVSRVVVGRDDGCTERTRSIVEASSDRWGRRRQLMSNSNYPVYLAINQAAQQQDKYLVSNCEEVYCSLYPANTHSTALTPQAPISPARVLNSSLSPLNLGFGKSGGPFIPPGGVLKDRVA